MQTKFFDMRIDVIDAIIRSYENKCLEQRFLNVCAV